MDAKLVVVGGDAQAAEYVLELPTVVGRSRSANLMVAHPLVSRQHCELYEADGRLMVRDLGSLNGTFVGDSRIAADTPLPPGGLLTIGSVTFRADYDSPHYAAAYESTEDSPTDLLENAKTVQADQTVEAGLMAEPPQTVPVEIPADADLAGSFSEADGDDERAGLDLDWLSDDEPAAALAGEPEAIESFEPDAREAPDAELLAEQPDELSSLSDGSHDDEPDTIAQGNQQHQDNPDDERDLDDFFKSLS